MTQSNGTVEQTLSPTKRLVFVLTICTGSFLLFLVQPMIARMALPRLGGAPTVWNSAMLVYQALLLAGYAYAHWLGRFAPRRQAAIHLVFFLVAAVMLPIGLSATSLPDNANPIIWVPWLLLSSIGPLFFVVSAQAPLMQRWFASAGGGDPYRLYAASNLGSFAGLISYPLLVEPTLPLAQQSWMWSFGYALLFAMVAACAFTLSRTNHAVALQTSEVADDHGGTKRFAYWALLAAIPSGLMLSTTLYLTTDIVAMPLLWVLPLGLYLLSFSLAFSDNDKLFTMVSLVTPLVLVAGGATAFKDGVDFQLLIAGLSLALLFLVSVALHGQLYRHRPAPAHLTRFYLAMSVGGVIGGLFCALLAPLLFNWGYEHPILLLAAAFVIPQYSTISWVSTLWAKHGERLKYLLPLLALAMSLFATDWLTGRALSGPRLNFLTTGILLICVFCRGYRLPFTLGLAALMMTMGGWQRIDTSLTPGAMTRSYFGVYAVKQRDGDIWTLTHGTTLHGTQNRSPGKEKQPLSYYAPRSGVGLAMNAAPTLFGDKARIGFVGLGTGTLACFSRPGQTWRIYEIDPAIKQIASDPKRFSYLANCLPNADIAIGDARLVLAREPAGRSNLLAIDAFSSDAVPMHLLTQEAFDTYARYLKQDGLLMVHISNRYLDLSPVVAGNLDKGWHGMIRSYSASEEEKSQEYTGSIWVAMSRDQATLDRLKATAPEEQWSKLEATPGFKPWTDDFASIMPILRPFWKS